MDRKGQLQRNNVLQTGSGLPDGLPLLRALTFVLATAAGFLISYYGLRWLAWFLGPA